MTLHRKPTTRRQRSIFEKLEGRQFMSASTFAGAPSTPTTGSTPVVTADKAPPSTPTTPTTHTTIHDITITKYLDRASA